MSQLDPEGCGEVLICDEDPDFRVFVASALEVAGFATREACCGEEALGAARTRRPTAVVLDVILPRLSGYEVCRQLRDEFGSSLPILFASGKRVESYDRVAGLLLGADDYLVKPVAPDELVARVRVLVRRASASASAVLGRLTRRELEVLRLLADGRNQREIAAELVISPKTVGTHIEHILTKLRVHSRAEAVAVAYRDELLGVPV